MDHVSRWWHPRNFADRAATLRARGAIKCALREVFAEADFTEVDTPVLQVSPGHETHVAAFATTLADPDGRRRGLYLHTSPELTCKKLLAAGMSRLVTFAPTFRNGERGRLHHPEFTMLEWYRAGGTLDDLVADVVAVLRRAAEAAGTVVFAHGMARADPFAPPEVVTVADAFRRYAGFDLVAALPENAGGRDRLAEAARGLGLRVASDDTWSDLFSKILSDRVEPRLGVGRASVLARYPASEAALARLCPDDPRFAERFEVFVCGVELANAFAELGDPEEQRRRFIAAEDERARIYGTRHPIDEDFLAALSLMPPASGIALGFDRLVMLATGAPRIADVLWAPVAEVVP